MEDRVGYTLWESATFTIMNVSIWGSTQLIVDISLSKLLETYIDLIAK